jgi:hypothetical protein
MCSLITNRDQRALVHLGRCAENPTTLSQHHRKERLISGSEDFSDPLMIGLGLTRVGRDSSGGSWHLAVSDWEQQRAVKHAKEANRHYHYLEVFSTSIGSIFSARICRSYSQGTG